MATYEKIKLSADPTGDGINFGFGGSNVHTTGTSSTVIDEVWLYASVDYAVFPEPDAQFTLNFGGNSIVKTVNYADGYVLIVPGLILSGNGSSGTSITISGVTVDAGLVISGYVNRITP